MKKTRTRKPRNQLVTIAPEAPEATERTYLLRDKLFVALSESPSLHTIDHLRKEVYGLKLNTPQALLNVLAGLHDRLVYGHYGVQLEIVIGLRVKK
jgi:hypothetical protein